MSLSDTDLIKIRKLLESGDPDFVRKGWSLIDDLSRSPTEPTPELSVEIMRQAVAAKVAMLEAIMRLDRETRDRVRRKFAAELVTPDINNGCRGCKYDVGRCGFPPLEGQQLHDALTTDTPAGAVVRWMTRQHWQDGYPDGPLVPCPGREAAE